MYKKSAILDKDIKWLVEHSYSIYQFSCDQWSSKEVALKDLGLTLLNLPGPPDYYDTNLDAFNDNLAEYFDIPLDEGNVRKQPAFQAEIRYC